MNHGSLFSGIGGFDYAAQMMGWNNVFHCEVDPFCQKVLQYYWPNSISHGNIKESDFNIYRGRIDILSGGFPCQPFSQAGKRLGKEDDRHLWPEMLRAIREIKPKFVVGENVPGLINWNEGMVFEEVQSDLEAEGYEVQPILLPAVAIDAPHRRDRIWFVAHSIDSRYKAFGKKNKGSNGIQKVDRSKLGCRELDRTSISPTSTNPIFKGPEGSKQSGIDKTENKGRKKGTRGSATKFCYGKYWDSFPTQSPICGGDDGLPTELDGITFPKWRSESIKAFGNAIVPQVALQIFKAIEETI